MLTTELGPTNPYMSARGKETWSTTTFKASESTIAHGEVETRKNGCYYYQDLH